MTEARVARATLTGAVTGDPAVRVARASLTGAIAPTDAAVRIARATITAAIVPTDAAVRIARASLTYAQSIEPPPPSTGGVPWGFVPIA